MAATAVEEEKTGRALDAEVGTLVHAYLEAIAATGPEAWPAERVREAAPAMRVWLSRRGYSSGESAEGAERVQAALLATLKSEAGRWVLASRPHAAAELALVSRAENGLATQIVDRTFIDGGERWIVDYKTAAVEGDAASLAEHAESYRPQLEGYARLFAEEGLSLRMAVFYTASGCLVELRQSN